VISRADRIRGRLSINPDELPPPPPAAAQPAEGTVADAPAEPKPAEQPGLEAPAAAPRRAARRAGSRTRAADAEPSDDTGAGPAKTTPKSSRSSRKPATRKAPSSTAETTADPEGGVESSGPRAVRVPKVSTAEASKQMIYLHPDEFRALGLAKLDDHVSVNIRIRAMIALWEANPRFRRAVDKIAATTPRGGG